MKGGPQRLEQLKLVQTLKKPAANLLRPDLKDFFEAFPSNISCYLILLSSDKDIVAFSCHRQISRTGSSARLATQRVQNRASLFKFNLRSKLTDFWI